MLHAVNAFLWCVWWYTLNTAVLPRNMVARLAIHINLAMHTDLLARCFSFSHEIAKGEEQTSLLPGSDTMLCP